MEETLIVKSDKNNLDKLKFVSIIFFVIAIILYMMYSIQYNKANEVITTYWDAYHAIDDYNDLLKKSGKGYQIKETLEDYKAENEDFIDYGYDEMRKAKNIFWLVAFCSLAFLASGIIYLYIGRTTITVTDKRIYGKAIFGKNIDIPINSIIFVEIGQPKKITIATSAGKIQFAGIKNVDEIYGKIQTILSNK